MLKRLKALGNKIRYINRVLIDINSKQTALQSQNAELAEELSRISSCVGMLDQQIKALGEKAKKRVEEEYSWDIIVDKYENIFRRQYDN